MSQASEAYTLGALDLNQNVKSELVDLRAQGNRRMSDEDIKTFGKEHEQLRRQLSRDRHENLNKNYRMSKQTSSNVDEDTRSQRSTKSTAALSSR